MDKLLEMAKEAREKAYAPYSGFKVGAALETEGGRVYTGCNVENASYGLALCAERVALFKAVSDGERKFRRLIIVADTKEPCPPCGACRQTLMEFGPDLEIVMANLNSDKKIVTVKDLLPNPFYLKNTRNFSTK